MSAPRASALHASALLAGAAILAQVAYPLTPEQARPTLTVLTVLTFAAASLTHAVAARGLRWAGAYTVITVGTGLAVEAVGVASGLPFGSYGYNDTLGPGLLGVPLVIPLAWAMMAYPAYVAARRLVPNHRAARIAVAAWALATWDLFLDPQMVGAGHWTWDNAESLTALPGVPDIPVGNYLGWLLVSLLVMALVESAAAFAPPVTGRSRRPDGVPHALYLWTYASSTLAAAAFFGNPGAAVWGGLLMGIVAIPLAVSLAREWRQGPDLETLGLVKPAGAVVGS